MSESGQPTTTKSWPDYRAVWRWHFYAGLITLPFVIVLSISGAIYLFKPQIEAWNDRAYDSLDINGPRASVAEQVQAALAFVPESTPSAYELPQSPNHAARVVVRGKAGEQIRVYVHPQTLQVLHSIPENERFMRWLFRLHGELLMGNRGSNIVELAASWTIIMVVTGLYLWWPRNATGLGGVLYPRLRMGKGIFWRDIHSVTGVWISFCTLFLLATGLPWAKFWGTYFKEVRHITGTAVAQQDWTVGAESNAGAAASIAIMAARDHGAVAVPVVGVVAAAVRCRKT
ncbi:MAG: PepSY-associated TM helix domain-containing protein [Planctomycetota bacterium]|nr:MAG: PepSY-associated TM helix domain-containing protein [Planctomycetota bacterium]